MEIVDDRFHGVEPARIGERAHGGALLETVAELDVLGKFGEALHEAVIDRLLHIKARRRNADLPGIAILERRDGVGGLFRIGVAEHDDRRMAAEFHGRALHAFGGEAGEMLADRHRAGEGNLAHDSEPIRCSDTSAGTPNTRLQTPFGKSGIDQAAHEFDAGARRLFGRLDDDRATGRERGRDLAGGRQRREIPRREGGGDADRLLDHQAGACSSRGRE